MTKNDFLVELQDMLQTDTKIDDYTDLTSLEEWDSITFMVLIAFFDKNFSTKLTFESLAACRSPLDLIVLAQGAII